MLAVPLTDYYEEVRRYLTCPEEVKDDLIYDVNRKVMDLNADRPDLDYNGILEFLGDPEDLANSLMEQMSDEVIQKFEKKKKHIRTGIIACAVAVVVPVTPATMLLYIKVAWRDTVAIHLPPRVKSLVEIAVVYLSRVTLGYTVIVVLTVTSFPKSST